MVIVKVNDLMQKVYDKFKAAGVSNEQASIVTDLLIYADLRGIHSHGVLRIEHYIERIKAGGINLNSKFNIEEKRPSFALMDADGGFGHVATQYAMEWALETVEKQGIALIGIKNNSHAGALGYYNKMAIHQNKVSLIMVNTDPCVIPFGGKRSFFGTNPISYGFPGKKDFILGDMATSEVSLGRIFTARENNETVPTEDSNSEDSTESAYWFIPQANDCLISDEEKEQLQRLEEIQSVIGSDRGFAQRLPAMDISKLPKDVQDAIRVKDQLKATEAYIKYCDNLFHKSKTAGATVQESVENVFGKDTKIKPHTYDLSK